MATIHLLLKEFAEALTSNFAAAEVNPAQAEDQLKGPVQHLLKRAGAQVGLNVEARTEARTDLGVRPDLGVTVDGLLAGHIELKAPGKGVQPRAFPSAHDREQFKKLADHPNLLYTDGNDWALYRHGELVGSVVRADGDVTSDGPSAFLAASALAFETALQDFLRWEPLVPSTPKALAQLLAPLTRLLRENVRTALADPESALSKLAAEWRDVFFPDADDAQFADAYAQTLTYALLLARVEGEAELRRGAADRLDERHGLLAQVLRVLTDPAARDEVQVPVDLLERSISAVDPEELARRAKDRDLWLYFYEDFLAEYDPRLRKQRGVYFTPPAVVQAQIALVSELLRERFDAPLGFAADEVTVLDPAVGTGTYLLAALQSGLELVRTEYGEGALGARATTMAQNFHGFELLIGSYAVAHLRVSKEILDAGGELPAHGTHIYLTDTLESPHEAPPGYAHAPLFQRKLAEENERARRVKTSVPILVCIGNPPYFRQLIGPEESGVERMGGWVREGDHGKGGILREFLHDTPGVHAKNLYNLYVYFWRWALWKVFENAPGGGIVSFITASSYLRGPGFAGMRRLMRETFDDLWILDLGGEGRGARKSENVFDIQTPVAIAIGVRYGEASSETPAHVRYARVDGTTREATFAALNRIEGFADVNSLTCFSDWQQPFLPETAGDYFAWPALTDLFPWQHSGAQFKRTWPIAPDRETLERRWRALSSAPDGERARLFRETRDRKVTRTYQPLREVAERDLSVGAVASDSPTPTSVEYAYRSLDRQYCFADSRLGDFLRPVLWQTVGAKQLFMTSLLTGLLGEGPAAIVTHLVPDLDHFRGSYGAKHVIPLWRNESATHPNVTRNLLEHLGERFTGIEAVDLFAYCYGVLSAPDYTTRFAEDLEVPGPRIPLTNDPGLFRQAIRLGERLIWLHAFCERLVPPGERAGSVPQGHARATKAVGGTPDAYPTSHHHDAARQRLHVGDGVFEPVSNEVRAYGVSGLDVIGSWLDYRMRQGAGKKSSPLDDIRPEVWPAAFTEELLRVLWIIEHTVALKDELNDTLDRIVSGPTIDAAELPAPNDEERAPPESD